jgi:hypothetical protein
LKWFDAGDTAALIEAHAREKLQLQNNISTLKTVRTLPVLVGVPAPLWQQVQHTSEGQSVWILPV